LAEDELLEPRDPDPLSEEPLVEELLDVSAFPAELTDSLLPELWLESFVESRLATSVDFVVERESFL